MYLAIILKRIIVSRSLHFLWLCSSKLSFLEMDSKRNKRIKKTSNDPKAKVQYHEPEPEVFVLPPDILQKLGIDLEKVNSNKKKPEINSVIPEINNIKKINSSQTPIVAKQPQKPQDSDAIRDASLMETAALMKNSVFLSPTFATVTTNTGELELLALDNKTVVPSLITCESDNLINIGTTKCFNVKSNSNFNPPTFMTVNNISPVEKIIPMDITVESVEVPTTELSEKQEVVLTDDHLDEAYLSDCSSSNFEPMENINNSIQTPRNGYEIYLSDCSITNLVEPVENTNNTIQTPRNGKKITIISEEILTPYLADYSKTRNSEMADLSLAYPVSRDSSISPTNNVVNLSIKSNTTPVHCYQSKISKDKKGTGESENHNDCLSDCIDISVTDIEEHLKENEEVLQEFANEIICNDSNDIINKIERSENLSYVTDVINLKNTDLLSVSKHENDQLIKNGNDVCIYNNSSNDTPSQKMLNNTVYSDSNDLLTHSITNTKTSVISNYEGLTNTGRELDFENKVGNSLGFPLTQSIRSVYLPQKSKYGMSDTNKNIDNSVKNNNGRNSKNNVQDKVAEISIYLKQCLNKVKTRSLTKANDTKESYPRKLEQKDLKSNQGVEKPGGNQHAQEQCGTWKKPIKTYGRATRKYESKTTFPTYSCYPKTNNVEMKSTRLTNKINAITVSDTTLHDFFCLCDDFGRMAFYDSDAPYKHIHFWEQRVSNIVPALVFSVYNDDIDCSISNPDHGCLNLDRYQEDDTLEMELTTYDICWNSMESGNQICDVEECTSNLGQVQQDMYSVDQNVAQVSDTVHNNMLDNLNYEERSTKHEEADKHENAEVPTKTETNMDTHCPNNISEKTSKSAVEQSLIAINCLPIDDATIQNEEVAEDAIVVIQIQENMEPTLAEKAQNIINDISSMEEKAHLSKAKEIIEPTHKSQRFTFDDEINHDQVPLIIEDDSENTPKSKNKKSQKNSEPTRKSRRFTFEDEIEDVPEQSPKEAKSPKSRKKKSKKRRKSSIQIVSDEEPLSMKKSRKHKSLDNESLKSSNVSGSNVEVAVHKSETKGNKVQCGVCCQAVNESDWFQHIGKEHSYIAWKLGEPAVDMDKEEEFETHLKEIVKQTEGLVCSKCGLTRKYVKPYLKHFNQCSGDRNVTIKLENVPLDFDAHKSTSNVNECGLIKCGVCNKEVKPLKWIKHIQMSHDYLAWKHGDTLDLDNPVAVNEHLLSILKNEGQLICSKCGLSRKYIKLYLNHIKVCTERTVTEENDAVTTASEEAVVCAVCNEEVTPKKWSVHNMKKHYNLSWIRGKPPVVTTSLNIIERLLKEYKNKYKELVCNICRISRVSFMGFYAHILVCGKSEEETEKLKILCNICNKKYIFLYQNQHITAHREQENAKERRMQAEIRKATQLAEQDAPETPSGRRRAAEKARTVIEKYNENTAATYKCEKCSFGSDLKIEYKKHKCATGTVESDVDLSAASESEDSYDDVDSSVSDEEKEKISVKKSKKDIAQSPVAKAKVLPFVAIKPKEYIMKSGEEYYKTYLSSEGLFPEWHNMAYEEISEQDMPLYMPPLKESCKVRISNAKNNGEWKTYERFDAVKHKDATALFVGASIQCASWAPPRVKDLAASREESAFLAVSVHRGADTPRFSANETQSHPAIIQIWDFGNFKSLPKFVLGLVHDYGTVWSMDWCPSGARDASDSEYPRLGLLATACSDGIVHIYSVPYPPSAEDSDKLFYRLHPVAELRISSVSDRKVYQATAVRWCKQIGHAIIFAGYSDGTTAFYDLNTDSPLLRTTENGCTVFYPYYDERAHASCVTDVSTFPCGARAGAAISCASSGVRVTSSPAVRPRRRGTHHAAVSVDFEPLFPHAIFTTDSSTLLASPPELDWAGVGRPLGSLGALASCALCGLCLVHSAPRLRTVRPHPAYLESRKQCFGSLDMIALGKKRKKPLKDDNLATVVEPTTYEEAIKKYGVELRIDKDVKPVNSRQREMYAERFPLCNPATMAFCPAPAHHDRVAIATHSGVIFVTDVSNRF